MWRPVLLSFANATEMGTWLGFLWRNILASNFVSNYRTPITLNFSFSTIQFCGREIARAPKKILFLGWDELGSLSLRGISPKLNETATNPKILMLRFLSGIKIKTLFQNFGRAAPEAESKSLYSGTKILKYCSRLFLCFRNSQNLVPTS